MKFKITISELNSEVPASLTAIYEQTVQMLNIKAVIEAVNNTPRAIRSDRGKKHIKPVTQS